jgi:exoribonuclease-2
MPMNEGKIVEYIDQGKFVCAVCIQDKGNRLHLLTTSNREVNLSLKRALLISDSTINILNSREELIRVLREKEEERNRLMRGVRVEELWELIRDENESYDYRYLAQLSFGDMADDEHISALVRALFKDRLYFKMRDGRFLPNTEELVEQITREKEEEARREEKLQKGSGWLKKSLQAKEVLDDPLKGEVIDLLISLALYGKEAQEFKDGKEILQRSGISDYEKARDILIKLGIWDEDENLDLFRFEIRTSFSEEQITESERLSLGDGDLSGYEDLRELAVFTIDGPMTMDFDDALSVTLDGDVIEVGIHITDAAGVVSPGSMLDREAALRCSSLYLPRRQIPMLPSHLSHETLSLKEGCDRPVISLISRFDQHGDLVGYRFVPSIIRVKNRFTYEEANLLCAHDDPLRHLNRLCRILRRRRVDQGALMLSLPEISIQVEANRSISLALLDQNTPARVIVAEMMIFYNWMAARFCKDQQIPILYRGQEAPSERLSIGETGYLFYVFKQRRKLHPLMIDTESKAHSGLGLDTYTQVSSPIRRYLDLVVQCQIRNCLFESPPHYDKESLEQIRMTTTPTLRVLDRVKRNRIRYWTQKYLYRHMGESYPAQVINVFKSKYRLVLTDYLLVAEMRREEGQSLSEGDKISVEVAKCDPWNDQVQLRRAKSL